MNIERETIMKLIMGILVIIFSTALVANVLFPGPVQSLASFVMNALNPYGQPILVPLTNTRDPALDSVNGLLYGINRVAWFDKNNIVESDITKYNKKFDEVDVVATYYSSNTLDMKKFKGDALAELGKKTYECVQIFFDKGQINTLCFDFSGWKGTPEKYEEALKHYKDYTNPETGKKECEDDCQQTLNNIISMPKNYEFVIGKEISEEENVKVCIKRWFLSYSIKLVKESQINECNLPESDSKNMGILVKNFKLPQEITKSNNGWLKISQDWLNAHGDPKYILYYEVFPTGEDQYWQPAAYAVDYATILTVEGVFLAIDMVPVVGKVVSKIIPEPVKEIIANSFRGLIKKLISARGLRAVTTINEWVSGLGDILHNVLEGITKGTLDLVSRLFGRFGEFASQRVFRTMFTEELSEDFLKTSLPRLTSRLKAQFPNVEKELFETINMEFERDIRLAGEEMGENLFKKVNGKFTGELSEDALKRLEGRYKTILMQQIDELGETQARQISKEFTEELGYYVATEGTGKFMRAFKLGKRVNNYLQATFVDLPKEKREEAVKKLLTKDLDYLKDLKPSDFNKLSREWEKNVKIAMDMQTSDKETFSKFLGVEYTDFQWNELSKAQKEEALTKRFSELFQGIDIQSGALQRGQMIRFGQSWASEPRHIITAAAVLYNDKFESIYEKFIPVGTNAIGVRTPYLATAVYDDTFTEGFDYKKDKKRYETFFDIFGGYNKTGQFDPNLPNRNRGLLPDVESYYLSLQRDQNKIWLDQSNERLHLVSPCEADLLIRVTNCDCYGGPKEETRGTSTIPVLGTLFEHEGIYVTGENNPLLGEEITFSDDPNDKMLYTIGENGIVVKQCYHSLIKEAFGADGVYTSKCIVVNPILKETDSSNYCYHGQKSADLVAADIGLNYAGPMIASVGAAAIAGPACGVVGSPTVIGGIVGLGGCGIIGGALGGALAGAAGSIAYATMAVDNAWPNHNTEG